MKSIQPEDNQWKAFCLSENDISDILAVILADDRTVTFGKGQVGILSLSDEILLDILCRVRAQGSLDPLLRTSRSIRTRIMKIPKLWTVVSTKKNPEKYLEWNKTSKLDVIVCEGYGEWFVANQDQLNSRTKELSNAKTFLSLLEPHSSRWKSFSFLDRKDEACLMKILAAESFPKTFPALKHLLLNYYEPDSGEIGESHNTVHAARDFVNHWEMPSLKHLTLTNFIPSRIQGSPTTFDFSLTDEDEHYEKWNLTRLTTLLGSFKLLRKLSISLCYMYDGRHEGSPALLENLEELKLTVAAGSVDFMVTALASFEAPNVRNLSLDFMCEEDPIRNGNDYPLVNALFPNDRPRWPKAKSLSIRLPYHLEGGPGRPSCLHIALARLPRLNDLTVRSTYRRGAFLSRAYRSPKLAVHPSLLREGRSSFPPLRSLSLNRCPFDADFFKDHADIFNSPKFRRMEIQRCDNIGALALRGLLPANKVLCYGGKHISPLMKMK